MDVLDRIRQGEWGTRDVLDAVEQAMDRGVPMVELDAAIAELRVRTLRPEFRAAGLYQLAVLADGEETQEASLG